MSDSDEEDKVYSLTSRLAVAPEESSSDSGEVYTLANHAKVQRQEETPVNSKPSPPMHVEELLPIHIRPPKRSQMTEPEEEAEQQQRRIARRVDRIVAETRWNTYGLQSALLPGHVAPRFRLRHAATKKRMSKKKEGKRKQDPIDFELGDPVTTIADERGVVRYIGPLAGHQGLWCGLELAPNKHPRDDAIAARLCKLLAASVPSKKEPKRYETYGKDAGFHDGTAYFVCRTGHSLFLRTSAVLPRRTRKGVGSGKKLRFAEDSDDDSDRSQWDAPLSRRSQASATSIASSSLRSGAWDGAETGAFLAVAQAAATDEAGRSIPYGPPTGVRDLRHEGRYRTASERRQERANRKFAEVLGRIDPPDSGSALRSIVWDGD